jgi:hypothetical protein
VNRFAPAAFAVLLAACPVATTVAGAADRSQETPAATATATAAAADPGPDTPPDADADRSRQTAGGLREWLDGEDATGTWGGVRTKLEQHGLHIDVDYVAETFARDLDTIGYRANLDVLVTLDTEKAGLWRGGNVLVYGQDAHGDGVSDELGLVMPVSFYEAGDFTQVSELWLLQELPGRLTLRLGKQDANRDFAAPRFGGNFMNSSYGVLPTTPMPSFPAPALGASLSLQATPWLALRTGVYDGAPRMESFAGAAFEKGAGVFSPGALVVGRGADGPRDLSCQLGGWHHSDLDTGGAFAIAELLLRLLPREDGSPRSVQLFARGQWEPNADASRADAPVADLYLGGGVTAHGLLEADHTIGIGAGYVSLDGDDEGFVEIFSKWRPATWFTVEPDAQFYFQGAQLHVLSGLRVKVKL